MAIRSTLDLNELTQASQPEDFNGNTPRSIGPSDSSDSGSDLIGSGTADDELLGLDGTSDRSGTGERPAADGEPELREGGDIAPDRIVGAEEAGLGGGLDQAEEARYGITDEELARNARDTLARRARNPH